jgi:predicted dehydrogenase
MTLGIGLVGCGQWGLNYLRTFSELDGCRVAIACDADPARLREVERRIPGIRTTPQLGDVLDDPSVNAVVVTDVEQARQLRDLAATTGRRLMVGHVFRFNSAVTYLQQLIGSGAMGDLEYLYFTRTNLGPIRSDVNVVWDLMTHDISILLHFLNQTPAWASGQGASYLSAGCEDIAFATLGFESGVIANIRASWLDPRKVREITVVGSSKMAVFNDLDPTEPVRIFNKGAIREPSYESFGEFKLVTRSGEVVSPAIPPSEPLKNQCQHFVKALTSGSPLLADANDGLRVVEIVSAINRSIAERGVPQPLAKAPAIA